MYFKLGILFNEKSMQWMWHEGDALGIFIIVLANEFWGICKVCIFILWCQLEESYSNQHN